MNIWYIKKDELTTKQKLKTIIKDILLAILIPLSISVATKLYLFYYDKQYTIVYLLILLLVIFICAVTLSNKLFNKKRTNHVFIKDQDNRIIYCYLYHNGFNKYTPTKFYEETLNMVKKLKENTKEKSIFYDIATTKENYINFGQAINKIHSIEEYKNYYEIFLTDPKKRLLESNVIIIPKYIENIDTLLEELYKIKSLDK